MLVVLILTLVVVWCKIVGELIAYQILLHQWKKDSRFVDDYTCMCWSTNGACIYEGSHSFISTKEFWMMKKPKYE